MDLKKLERILADQPAFRIKQARHFIFNELGNDWSEATTLPPLLRQKLNQEFPLNIESEFHKSKDGQSIKALITLHDGLKIETVLMSHADRESVCVSTQVGCALACTFCATGQMGFKRNLQVDEIVLQVLLWQRRLKKQQKKVTNVIFMGMGEPLLNYDNLLEAIKIMRSEQGFGLGTRRFSISTIGIVDKILKLADDEPEINLALSLHVSKDDIRKMLIPFHENYSLAELRQTMLEYLKKTKRKIMIEYIMIDGINDSIHDARNLAKWLKNMICVVNLIPYNQTGVYKPTPMAQIKEFKKVLTERGVEVTERYKMGEDIAGACGQLAGQNIEKNKKL